MASERRAAFLKILPLLAITVAVALAACSDSGPAPAIDAISPDSHPFGAAPASRIVVVQGSGFWQKLVPNAANANASTLENPRVTIADKTAVLVSFGELALTVIVPTELVDPGRYAVRVENPDGRAVEREQAYRIIGTPTSLQIVSAAEGGDGSLNQATVTVLVLDQGGFPIAMDVPLAATAIANSSGTIAGGGAFAIASGSSAGTIQVNDVRAEVVVVGLDGITPPVPVVPGTATFIPGPAARVRVLGATSATPDVTTTVRIEDANGNQAAVHPDYSGFPFYTGACSGNASVVPDPVVIAANAGASTVVVTCATTPSSARLGLTDGAAVLTSTSGLLVWQ